MIKLATILTLCARTASADHHVCGTFAGLAGQLISDYDETRMAIGIAFELARDPLPPNL